MSKEFENDFFKELESSVVKDTPENKGENGKLEELVSKREQLLRTLEEMKSNVIVDPKAVKKIEKEIKSIEKAIESGNIESSIEETENADEIEEKEEEKLEDEKKSETVEEEKIATEQQEEQVVEERQRSDILKEQYEQALTELYEYRIANINLAKREGKLIIPRDAFEKEMLLEEKMYNLREEYMAMGFEDPFKEKRTDLIAKERAAKEPIEIALREKARKFREYEQELARMDKEENEIHEQLLNPDISSGKIEELNKELEELGEKRKDLELHMADIRKDLEPAIEERTRRTLQRAGLEEKHVETLTKPDKANYEYQKEKVQMMNYNTEKTVTQEYRHLKLRIEEREYHIKELKRELDKTPATDFERRLELLGKLDKETAMLEADEESKSYMDRGITPKETERKDEIIEKFEKEETRQEEFESQTETVRAIIEEQKEKTGEKVVEAPVKETIDDKGRETEAKAATFAILAGNPHKPGPDTLVDDVKQYAVAKCVIEGLEDKVRDPNNPEDAAAIVENEEQIQKANEELERQQEELADKVV